MKNIFKIFYVIFIALFMVMLGACGDVETPTSTPQEEINPFTIHKSYNGRYHYQEVLTFYENDNSFIGRQTIELYDDDIKGIRYSTSYGFVGDTKTYTDTVNMYSYEYDFSNGWWYREKWNHYSTNGFNGFWDINNYNLIGGVYKLKSNIDTGQIQYTNIFLNSSNQIEMEQKYVVDPTYYVIKKTIFFDGNKDYNLQLPKNYYVR